MNASQAYWTSEVEEAATSNTPPDYCKQLDAQLQDLVLSVT